MLFNSYLFIFLYLPIVLIGTYWLGRYTHRLAALWLGIASLAFYAVWDARFVMLLMLSICFNYGAGCRIADMRAGSAKHAKWLLAAAIVANLVLLAYFKYANFFIASINQLSGRHVLNGLNIILPLGISFFTFTQIAFLVDVYRGVAREFNFVHYLLFVTYFPHLIAGPILHHKQMMPQFSKQSTFQINPVNLGVGLTIFVLGLAKKVLIADTMAEYATPIFNAASGGHTLMLVEAWIGALAYSLQLYFDFSGYSDMAIGLSLMFNVRLPMNFNSPYKAYNIIDFWRRWHMTLSAFLREYLYYPLGGNRKGALRRYVNLMITMLFGGLWHGANWTFVAWGGLHGIYLTVNHGWLGVKKRWGWNEGGRFWKVCARGVTFLAVVVGWVLFRADTFSSARSMLTGMIGLNGISVSSNLEAILTPLSQKLPGYHFSFQGLAPTSRIPGSEALDYIVLCLAAVWSLPNIRQMLLTNKPTWEDIAEQTPSGTTSTGTAKRLTWKLSAGYAVVIGILFFIALIGLSNKKTEFLYFQF